MENGPGAWGAVDLRGVPGDPGPQPSRFLQMLLKGWFRLCKSSYTRAGVRRGKTCIQICRVRLLWLCELCMLFRTVISLQNSHINLSSLESTFGNTNNCKLVHTLTLPYFAVYNVHPCFWPELAGKKSFSF